MEIDIKYSPTDELITRPLDRIDKPWYQPKRCELTAFWKPGDAERFAKYLAEQPGVKVFSEKRPDEFTEARLSEIKFHPELTHDLLFTNMDGISVPQGRDPEKSSPFLRLDRPTHMGYFSSRGINLIENVRLLFYIKYSQEVVRRGVLEKQPASFLAFAREACDWLKRNYVSSRGRNTVDNLAEYLEVKDSI